MAAGKYDNPKWWLGQLRKCVVEYTVYNSASDLLEPG